MQGKPISEVLDAKASDFDSPDALAELLQSISNGTGDEPLTIDVKMEKPQTRYLEVTSFHIPAGSDESMTGLLARDVTQEREMAERRDSFVSIASHELRTPMTTIMGFSELLLNNSDLPEDSRREWLQRIHQNSQVLSAIVDDMLDVSRIQTGRLGINWEDLRIKDIVDEVLVGIKAETDEHEFSVNVAADLPTVAADREKLTQIVINLLTNAVKYSPKGGTITVSASGDADNGRVVVEVADQGMGIAPENIDQLFNSFHRISRPETEGIRGTGLGLSIVKGLAQLMRGDAWVESELNVGSRFFFSVNTQRPNVTEEEDALSAV